MDGIKVVHELLKTNEGRIFEVLYHIGKGEPVSHFEGKPTSLLLDYIDKEIGYALAIHFEALSIECTEDEFYFQTGISTVDGKPYGPFAVISLKANEDTYISIEFK